jgi:hypothetical protein
MRFFPAALLFFVRGATKLMENDRVEQRSGADRTYIFELK